MKEGFPTAMPIHRQDMVISRQQQDEKFLFLVIFVISLIGTPPLNNHLVNYISACKNNNPMGSGLELYYF